MRRMLFALLVVLAHFAGGNVACVFAQSEQRESGGEESELPELETDRDAFTPATSTAGCGLTIVESSYSFIDHRSVTGTHSFPELLVRYGMSDRIELRLGWNYEIGGGGDVSGDEGSADMGAGGIERDSKLLYGFKAAVTEQDGWRPRSVAILQGYTPTSGETTASDVVFAYAFGWEFDNHWRLDSSIRYGTSHELRDEFNEWAPSVVLRIPLSEQWTIHVEYFGIFSQGAEQEFSRSYFSPGVHYLLTPNLELGVRVGWGLTEDAPRFFSNVGIGWRF
jgi:Putative MetA-pathway of phenol degradation